MFSFLCRQLIAPISEVILIVNVSQALINIPMVIHVFKNLIWYLLQFIKELLSASEEESESPFGGIKLKKAQTQKRELDQVEREKIALRHHDFEKIPLEEEVYFTHTKYSVKLFQEASISTAISSFF